MKCWLGTPSLFIYLFIFSLTMQGLMALMEMVEFYEGAFRLILPNNNHIHRPTWLAMSRMLKKVSYARHGCDWWRVCGRMIIDTFVATFRLNFIPLFWILFNWHHLAVVLCFHIFILASWCIFTVMPQSPFVHYLDVSQTATDLHAVPLLGRSLRVNCGLATLHLERNGISGARTVILGEWHFAILILPELSSLSQLRMVFYRDNTFLPSFKHALVYHVYIEDVTFPPDNIILPLLEACACFSCQYWRCGFLPSFLTSGITQGEHQPNPSIPWQQPTTTRWCWNVGSDVASKQVVGTARLERQQPAGVFDASFSFCSFWSVGWYYFWFQCCITAVSCLHQKTVGFKAFVPVCFSRTGELSFYVKRLLSKYLVSKRLYSGPITAQRSVFHLFVICWYVLSHKFSPRFHITVNLEILVS